MSSQISTEILVQIVKPRYILPYYHCISDEPKAHIDSLYQHRTRKEFIQDLDFLLKNFRAIEPGALSNSNAYQKDKKVPFLISFDDGLSEFYHIAAPLLEEKGISAICFLNTDFVDNKSLFYRYKASLIVQRIRQNDSYVERLKNFGNNLEDCIQFVLKVKYEDSHILDEIASRIKLDFQDFLNREKPYLSKSQILELKDRGFYFGAHSIDHPLFKDLNLDEQVFQLSSSMDFVKNNLKPDFDLFSFPFTDFGVKSDFIEKVRNQYQNIKIFGGAGLKYENSDFHFQRISFERADLNADEIVNGELLYYLLKAPFGKNTMIRE